MGSIPFTMTQDSITIMWQGKPVTVKEGAANFPALREALFTKNWDAVEKNLTIPNALEQWAMGEFKVSGETIYYKGEALPTELNQRIARMAACGKNPTPLFNFWERLQRNPSKRSVEQLYPFLAHRGIPLTSDGCFLAYKGVRPDYRDCHSGKFDNSPGNVHQMDRNKISDDPREACHEGFHVGALEYARGFGEVVVVCKVDPEHVVCIPYDSSHQKMRVCKYKVVSDHYAKNYLSDTIVDLGDDDVYEEVKVAKADVREPVEFENEPGEMYMAPSAVEFEPESGEPDHEEPDDDEDPLADDAEDEYEEDDEDEEEDDPVVEQVKPKRFSELKNQVVLPAVLKDNGKFEVKVPGDVKKEETPESLTPLEKMNKESLESMNLHALRSYAAKELGIVGASKIPGGKPVLIERVLKELKNKKGKK